MKIGYEIFWIIVKIIKYMPYNLRVTFWWYMYKYNKKKYPNITWELYKSYASEKNL